MRLLAAVSVLCFTRAVSGFNLDVDGATVFERGLNTFSEKDETDLYGFSVSIVPRTSKTSKAKPWLMVGAPNMKSDLRALGRSGNSLKCEMGSNSNTTCKIIKERVNYETWETIEGTLEADYNRMRLGFAQDANNELFVMCAPALGAHSTYKNQENWKMHGACIWCNDSVISENMQIDEARCETLVPFNDPHRNLKLVGGNQYKKNFNQGEAGFSVEILKTAQGETQLLIGAPNVMEGTGAVILYTMENSKFGKLVIPHTKDSLSEVYLSALGYSVSSGRYFSLNKTLYASGAPLYPPHGMVIVFDFPKTYNGTMKIYHNLTSEVMSDRFGSALTSGDLNNDKFDELIVGAPLYGDKTLWDRGRVLIYFGNSNFETPKIIEGTTAGGRFGTAVSFLGSLDHDNFGDFAVAAPYEGSGVVYIYFGGGQKNLKLGHKLQGSKYSPFMASFGYSISRGVDVDHNGFNDFAVGAYKSGHVVLFRSRPVRKLDMETKVLETALSGETKNFTVQSCVRLKGHRVPSKNRLLLTLDWATSANRIYFNSTTDASNLTENFGVEKNSSVCRNYTFFMNSNHTDRKRPLFFNFSYALDPKGNKKNELQPFTSGPWSRRLEINFKRNCGDTECVAKLHLDLKLLDENSQIHEFVLGSKHSVRLQATIFNEEMDAYDTTLEIKIPSLLHPQPQNSSCYKLDVDEDGEYIRCNVMNPLARNKKQTFVIDFDPEGTEVLREIEHFNISANATTVSASAPGSVKEANVTLPVVTEAGLTISGAQGAELSNFNATSKSEVMLKFHIDQVGVSPIQLAEFSVEVPVAIYRGGIFTDSTDIRIGKSGQCINTQPELNDPTNKEEFEQSVEEMSEEVEIEETNHTRRKREVTPHVVKFSANRILELNCTSTQWTCKKIACKFKPTSNNYHEIFHVVLKMDFTDLDVILTKKRKDVVNVVATASVKILQPSNIRFPPGLKERANEAKAIATLKTTAKPFALGPIELSLAIICSLLLLLLLVTGLVKVGFFKRQDKEALQKMMKMERPPLVSLKDLNYMNREYSE